jgi:glutamate dehydrogenase
VLLNLVELKLRTLASKLNTDAIDNSAGVDTSDHEVNIKILLDQAVTAGSLSVEDRNKQLAVMTDEVGELVLRDNYEQNLILEQARFQAPVMLRVHKRLMQSLESNGHLNRAIEYLPTDSQLRCLACPRSRHNLTGTFSPDGLRQD